MIALPAMLGLLAFGGCSSSSGNDTCNPPPSCPATYVGIVLQVNAASDGGAASGVGATLSGPAAVTMSCEPNGGQTLCRWPSGPVTPGSYTLQVTAVGFRTSSVSAKVTVSPPECGCTAATMELSSVTLDPS